MSSSIQNLKQLRADCIKQTHTKQTTDKTNKIEKVSDRTVLVCKHVIKKPLFSYHTHPVLHTEKFIVKERNAPRDVYLTTRKTSYPSAAAFEFDATPKRFATWIYTLKTLAQHLEWCNQHGICFFNIREDKIALDTNRVPVLYDFSESFLLNQPPTQRNAYHFFMPFECFVLYQMDQRGIQGLSQSNIEDICKTFVLHHPILTPSSVSKERIKRQYVDTVHTLLPWLNRPRRDMELFFYSHSNTWDLYSLCMLYLANLNRHYKEKAKDPFYNDLTTLFFESTHPDATKRPSWGQLQDRIDSAHGWPGFITTR